MFIDVYMIVGFILFVTGMYTAFQDNILNGLLMIGIAIVIVLVAVLFVNIEERMTVERREREAFEKWRKMIVHNGYDRMISRSVPFAIDIYNKNPGRMTLIYISNLNPEAGNYIKRYLNNNQNNNH